MKKALILLLKLGLIVLGIILFAVLIIPPVFEEHVVDVIKQRSNSYLKTELEFETAEVSFIHHFPALTFSFDQLQLNGLPPFTDKPLAEADELAFGLDIMKLVFSNEVVVKSIIIKNGNLWITKDKFGRGNYDIFQSDSLASDGAENELSPFDIQKLEIQNSKLFYLDEINNLTIETEQFDYFGKAELETEKLELKSTLNTGSINLSLDGTEFLKQKKLRIMALTVYDTKTLSIVFDENDISIHDLDIRLHGRLDIFEEGMSYELSTQTRNSKLRDLVSVLEPKYLDWAKNVDLRGDVDASFFLKSYSGTVPDSLVTLRRNIALRLSNGRIAHKNALQTVDNLFLNFRSNVNDKDIKIKIDSISFQLGEEISWGNFMTIGERDSMFIDSEFSTKINLDSLQKSLQLPEITFGGLLQSNWDMKGVYQPEAAKFPYSTGAISLENGFLKTDHFPEPLRNIDLDAKILNPGNSYKESELYINKLQFKFMDSPFQASAVFKNFDDPTYDIKGKGTIYLEKLDSLLNVSSRVYGGTITSNIRLKGKLYRTLEQNQDSVIVNQHSGTLKLENVPIAIDELEEPVLVREGTFQFLNDRMAFSNLELEHVNSKVTLQGHFEDFLDFVLYDKGGLKGSMGLQSDYVDITDFLQKMKDFQKLTWV